MAVALGYKMLFGFAVADSIISLLTMMVLEVLQIYTVGALLIGWLTYDDLRTNKGLWTNGDTITDEM